MTKTYFGIVTKEPDSDYGVHFPDFPGCVSADGSLDEMPRMATEALRLHVRGMKEDGEKIPEPSQLDWSKIEEPYLVVSVLSVVVEV